MTAVPMAAPSRLRPGWLAAGLLAVVGAALVGVAVGPVGLPPGRVALELLDRLPLVDVDSGLTAREQAIVWDLRAPRVVLGLLVGAMLSVSGAAYQGVFRNPLVDPYLLGVAAGAGLGATVAIVTGLGDAEGFVDPLPLAAFLGGLLAVALTALVGTGRRPSAPATLVLAGVAVSSFLTAVQTYLQQRHADNLRQVYSWILGRLSTSGWGEVAVVLPYAVVTAAVLLLAVGALDVMAVGDDEAAQLGLRPDRVRLLVLLAASLAASAAVAVSGLIGFVGLVVPHVVRLAVGTGNRAVIPLSLLFGAAFLALADVVARTLEAPAELPIGVVTAFVGAPFFVLLLRSRAVAG
jgi:iron complex transport system permease protein